MSEVQANVVRAVYTAMKQGEPAEMFRLIAPRVKIWQTEELPWGGTYEGLEEAKVFFGKVTSHLIPSVVLDRLIVSGEFVVALGRTQGVVKSTGKNFDVPLMHLWEVQEGKVIGLKVFLENETMKAALA